MTWGCVIVIPEEEITDQSNLSNDGYTPPSLHVERRAHGRRSAPALLRAPPVYCVGEAPPLPTRSGTDFFFGK